MRFLIFITIFLSVCLVGCSKTPMEKLADNQVYPELNNSFWADEHSNKSKLWSDALSYCKKQHDKPNCVTVMMEYAITNGSTTVPAIGHSGKEINIPNF